MTGSTVPARAFHPAPERNGFPVSAGGQITPPIMGAAAFVMAEFLEVPYTTVVLAAIVPAAMHYLGVMSIVHFQAKRLGLKGLPHEEIPKLGHVLRRGWPTAVPLLALIYVLFSGYSPHMAAFWGITLALVIGFINPMHRLGLRDVVDLYSLALVIPVIAAHIVTRRREGSTAPELARAEG